ncbi:unnamed protein product [Sphagnum jensenii]|uniref:Protein kinase domain-containing protein n=1 Tax=Sphagnum jensenii TaxID=128206 RepID=A0ABP1A7W2_9BRYO
MSSPMPVGRLRRGNNGIPDLNNHNDSGRRRRSKNNNSNNNFSTPSPPDAAAHTSVTPRAATTAASAAGGNHYYSSVSSSAVNGGGVSKFLEKVVVAIDSNKKITKNALEWALTNVLVHPGETIILLVLLPTQKPAAGVASSSSSKGITKNEVEKNLHHSCMLMVEELQVIYASKKINIEVKMVEPNGQDTVANEAKNLGATWIVLDRHLKKEGKCCVELLQCNIVVVNISESKILKLILKQTGSSPHVIQPTNIQSTLEAPLQEVERKSKNTQNPSREFAQYHYCGEQPRNRAVVYSMDPTVPCKPTLRVASRSASRASSRRDSPVKMLQRESPAKLLSGGGSGGGGGSSSNSSSRDQSPRQLEITRTGYHEEREVGQSLRVILQDNVAMDQSPFNGGSPSGYQGDYEPANDSPILRPTKQGKTTDGATGNNNRNRMAMMLSKHNLPGPPPLCSICQHKSPMFGKPPLRYTYMELERATGGFSQANFLAEGGYGSVHRGVLSDGQAVAVKQYKLASMQGDKEFCSEVEILSCAQHRNVVMLVGFCIEGKRRLLVYEFVCNGSLDLHLYDQERTPLEWASRQKIALGTARGLRYLHQECRVGCIVHRDLRPNNIVVTHDFEPMVGDFGLARWQPDGQSSVETRVLGTFGYLAPEYTQHGQVTNKLDVYSFGVVLLELVTGRKAIDITRPKGEQCLTEWARPLLEEKGTIPIDPRLDNRAPPVAAYFAERIPHTYMGRRSTGLEPIIKKATSPMTTTTTTTTTTTREETENPNSNLDAHQSDQESFYSSPNGDFGSYNIEYTPPFESTRSPTTTTTTKDFNSRLNVVTTPSPPPPPPPVAMHSASNLSFEALKSAYADKGYYAPVSAAAYESYSLGKDF